MAPEKVVYTCCGGDEVTGVIPEAKRLTPNSPVCPACQALTEAFWALME